MNKSPRSYTIARFLLDAPALPPVTHTVPFAEEVRRCLLRLFSKLHNATYSRTFSGKDEQGEPLRSHDHVYVLPTAENPQGRLDRLTLLAAAGFTADELAVLDRFRSLRFGDKEPVHLQLTGLGTPADFRGSLFGPSRVWVSATPFVVTRHVKTRGQKKDPPECRGMDGRPAFVERVFREELERLGERCPEFLGANAPEITLWEDAYSGPWDQGTRFRTLDFIRFRGKANDDGMRRPAGMIRLTFPQEVSGPVCLGHASHFGLGLFRPLR